MKQQKLRQGKFGGQQGVLQASWKMSCLQSVMGPTPVGTCLKVYHCHHWDPLFLTKVHKHLRTKGTSSWTFGRGMSQKKNLKKLFGQRSFSLFYFPPFCFPSPMFFQELLLPSNSKYFS